MGAAILLALILVAAVVVGLSKGVPRIVALFVLCGSGAASMIAAWFMLPALTELRRMVGA